MKWLREAHELKLIKESDRMHGKESNPKYCSPWSKRRSIEGSISSDLTFGFKQRDIHGKRCDMIEETCRRFS